MEKQIKRSAEIWNAIWFT